MKHRLKCKKWNYKTFERGRETLCDLEFSYKNTTQKHDSDITQEYDS